VAKNKESFIYQFGFNSQLRYDFRKASRGVKPFLFGCYFIFETL